MDEYERLYSEYYDIVMSVRALLETYHLSNEMKLKEINNLVKDIELEEGM